jgi:cytochrome b pre-mRNA-processing protein 3
MFRFSSNKRHERKAAERIYAAALAAARRPALYLDCGVPDTLQGRFEMVALHLFPVLHRLMHQPGDDPELARLISERFVDDMDGAFREMGVGDLSVPKRMKTAYRSFAGRLSAYGRAVGDGEGSLAEAIARNVFPEAPQNDHAAALAAYLNQAVAVIRKADIAALRGGDVPFPAPPAREASE